MRALFVSTENFVVIDFGGFGVEVVVGNFGTLDELEMDPGLMDVYLVVVDSELQPRIPERSFPADTVETLGVASIWSAEVLGHLAQLVSDHLGRGPSTARILENRATSSSPYAPGIQHPLILVPVDLEYL